MGTAARIDELRKKFDENPRRYFAPLANEYRKAGDLEQAIELCRQHLADQPTHMSGHIVFGQALFESAQLAEAQQVFTQALGLDPENLIALRHLGDIARAQGDTSLATTWYQRVLDADPRNDEIAAIVRELASAVPVEGFAGMPADEAEATLETPEVAPTETPVEASVPEVEVLALEEPETLVLPELPVMHASSLPPENVVEPLPKTIELSSLDALRMIEEARAAQEPVLADFEPTSWTPPEATAEVSAEAVGQLLDDPTPSPLPDAELEMPSAAEILHPAPPEAPAADPLADLPMEMLEDYGNASAESLLGSGAPAPESPLAALESGIGLVDDPAPLVSNSAVDSGLDFMDNPLAGLATSASAPEDPASSLDGLATLEDGNAFAPEPPLPPPVLPTFEPVDAVGTVDTVEPVAAPASEVAPRQPTPAAGVPFVTEAMGEVLEGQGLHAQAADVYRALLQDRPQDARISAKLKAVEDKLAPAVTVVEWLQAIAAGRLQGEPQAAPAAAPQAAPAAAPQATEPAPQVAAPAHSGSASASLDALFGPPTNAADERAAAALAALFDATATAISGAPTAPAADELSLRTVFEPPAAPAPRTSAAFSFDQFFSATPKTSTPAPGTHDPELAEFSRWLDGLKKQ